MFNFQKRVKCKIDKVQLIPNKIGTQVDLGLALKLLDKRLLLGRKFKCQTSSLNIVMTMNGLFSTMLIWMMSFYLKW